MAETTALAGWRAGAGNTLADIAGVHVGHAEARGFASGTTAIVFETPATASVSVLGGAPGTRETDLLDPSNTVSAVDAFVLSGGSAFGLDAGGGAMAALAGRGRGFEVAGARVPIVPAAILFDLRDGGPVRWGDEPPYRDLGRRAVEAAFTGADTRLGRVGAGTGCTTASGPGGLGTASTIISTGATVAAIVAVNAVGSPTIANGAHSWAAPFEIDAEFGGHGWPHPMPADAAAFRTKLDARAGTSTTIGAVVTDARLDKAACRRLAIAGHDGFAKALWPSHTDYDGDLVFAAATGGRPHEPATAERLELAAATSATMARAIARGVHAARAGTTAH